MGADRQSDVAKEGFVRAAAVFIAEELATEHTEDTEIKFVRAAFPLAEEAPHWNGAMRQSSSNRGATLVELVVVLAIIAILLGLLLPAISFSRERARRAACESNLHQLGIAMTHFVDVRKKLPDPVEEGTIGGWAIAILPYMEDTVLADGLSGNPPLDSATTLPLTSKRPIIMRCPSAYEGDSTIATIPASHYSAILTRKGWPKLHWQLGELSTDSRIPWVISPEAPFGGPPDMRPHSGGYNTAYGTGPKSRWRWIHWPGLIRVSERHASLLPQNHWRLLIVFLFAFPNPNGIAAFSPGL